MELISNKSASQNQKRSIDTVGICDSGIGRKTASERTNPVLHHGPGTVLSACVRYLMYTVILSSTQGRISLKVNKWKPIEVR